MLRFLRSVILAGGVIAAFCLPAAGQSADADHSAHHPEAPASQAPAAPAPQAKSTTPQAPEMGGMMGGMMGMPARKEFYPSLMDLPPLSADQRATVENQARTRIHGGLEGIAAATVAYRKAYSTGDLAGASQYAQQIRRNLDELSSGAATLQGLAEGKPPQQLALTWFKGQLGLSDDGSAVAQPFGISLFHLVTMAAIGTFAAVMLALYFVRVRSATRLVNRLAGGPSSFSGPTTDQKPVAVPALTPVRSAPPPAVDAPAANIKPRAANNALWNGEMRVTSIFRETPNVKTFRLADVQGGVIPFSFLPGQFLTFTAKIDGGLVRRSYTISSSPNQTGFVEATIKREEEGVLSRHMHDNVSVGDVIQVTAPSGVFTFRGKEADSVVLIGGGVGITPLMSAIRYLTDEAWPGAIYLVYGAKTTLDFIFQDELEYLQRRHPNLHVSATMMRAEGTSWMGAEGPITKEFLAQSVPELHKRRCHVCGPPAMMVAVKKALAELGVPKDQIKSEAFGTAKGAVPPPGVTEFIPDAGRERTSPPAGKMGTPYVGTATPEIRFAQSARSAPLPADKTVLEVAESIGVPIDFQCRVGTCGICKTKLIDGEVLMEVEDALTPEDKAQNIILACQAKSVGNLVVDA